MHGAVLGYEKTLGLGHVVEKIRLLSYFNVNAGQSISNEINVEIVIKFSVIYS